MTLVRWRRMISDRLVGTLLSQICQPIPISLVCTPYFLYVCEHSVKAPGFNGGISFLHRLVPSGIDAKWSTITVQLII